MDKQISWGSSVPSVPGVLWPPDPGGLRASGRHKGLFVLRERHPGKSQEFLGAAVLENIPAQASGFGFKPRAGNILRLPGFELQTRSRVSRRRHDDSASLILPGHEFPAPRAPKKPLQLVVNVTPCPHSAVSYWFQPHGIPCLSSSSLESFGNSGCYVVWKIPWGPLPNFPV